MSLNPNLPDFPRDMDGRVIFESLDESGNVIERTFGPSDKEKLDAHNRGDCDAFCWHCYEAACEWLAEQEENQSQIDYKNSLKNDY